MCDIAYLSYKPSSPSSNAVKIFAAPPYSVRTSSLLNVISFRFLHVALHFSVSILFAIGCTER